MDNRNKIWEQIDWLTVLMYLVLVLIGWLNIYSATYNEEYSSIFDFSQRYGKQLIWIICAFVTAFCIILIDSKFFASFSIVIYGVFILLLVVVLLVGKEIKGAKAWLVIGNIALQPSEFAKFGTALMVSKIIGSFYFKFTNKKKVLALILVIVLPMALILLQNDTGSMLVYFSFLIPLFREGMSGLVLFFALLFALIFVLTLSLGKSVVLIALTLTAFLFLYIIRKKPKEIVLSAITLASVFAVVYIVKYIASGVPDIFNVLSWSLFISAGLLLIVSFVQRIPQAPLIASIFIISIALSHSVDFAFNNLLAPHQKSRIEILLGKSNDIYGTGYHVNQSKIAIGSGGFSGKGFLNGTQTRYDFVPEQSTDFIFCTIGEEWGFIGSIIIITLFISLMVRIILVAEKQKSVFCRTYGYCVASIIFFHFTVNIGMTIGLAPVIGIPLPFLSYGGSSLWFFTILLFVFIKMNTNRNDILR